MISRVEAELVWTNALRESLLVMSSLQSERNQVLKASQLAANAIAKGGKIVVFGNGGSAAAAQHFAAEFTGKLKVQRPALAAMALTTDASAMTAIANDFGFEEVFSRQVEASVSKKDLVVGLSTSGASSNVILGIKAANRIGAKTISLLGSEGSLGAELEIHVQSRSTARVQEAHDFILHIIAQISERHIFELVDDMSTNRFPFCLKGNDLIEFAKWRHESGQKLVAVLGSGSEGSFWASLDERALGDILVFLTNAPQPTSMSEGLSRNPDASECRDNKLASDLGATSHVVEYTVETLSDVLKLLVPDVLLYQDEMHLKGPVMDVVFESQLPIHPRLLSMPNLLD